jgi:hypothetical protein
MALPTPSFQTRKGDAAPAQSNLIARLGMTVCFLATTALLIAGLHSVRAVEAGAHAAPAVAVAANVRTQSAK